MNLTLNIFFTFSRIGAVTFGGGYSMLPILRRDLVEKKNWLSDDDLSDYYAISQCIPGIIAVNTSILAGYKINGTLGGVAAALGVVFPSVAIILLIAAFISNFSDFPIVQHAFAGIRVCVCILILNTVLKLRKSALADKWSLVVFIPVFLLSVFSSVPAAVLVVTSGILGVGLYSLREHFK